MTCAASTFVDEEIGSCTASVTLTESETAWASSLSAAFASVSGERIDLGAGRLVTSSLITGASKRCPVQWADSIRSYDYRRDLSDTTWEKDFGPIDGWSIEGEYDERVSQSLGPVRFTTARTYGNGPTGAFISMSRTRASDESVLSLTHNMAVANLAMTVVQRVTESFIGKTPVLNAPNSEGKRTLTKLERTKLETRVNGELQRNLLAPVNGKQRASLAKWTAATDDDLGVANATLNGVAEINVNGTIVKVNTIVKVQ
jgi:hypothetical protein